MNNDAASATVSAVLIVKDEEAMLERCLAALTWTDEVVVYDTGSTDRTVAIARAAGATVVEGYWDDDFAAARNRALAHATQEWVLSVDADEVFVGDPRAVRRHLSRPGSTIRSIGLLDPSGVPSLGADLSLPRVFRRGAARWVGALHEQPQAFVAPTDGLLFTPLPGAAVQHFGYTTEVVAAKDKIRRNLTIAEQELTDALAAGDAAGAGRAGVNLARTLGSAGRVDEAFARAEEAVAGGALEPRHLTVLARSMGSFALLHRRLEEAERWTARWAEVAPTDPWLVVAQMRVAAARGDDAAVVRHYEALPSTSVGTSGTRFDRADVTDVALGAYVRTGARRRALGLAKELARLGRRPGSPTELLEGLGADGVAAVAGEMPDGVLVRWIAEVVVLGTPQARTALAALGTTGRCTGAVLSAAGHLGADMGLEEAAQWSAAMRPAGLGALCPLVAVAQDGGAQLRDRALAGALAWSAYGDERGLAALETVLPAVPADATAALLAELDVVAPGLVSSSV